MRLSTEEKRQGLTGVVSWFECQSGVVVCVADAVDLDCLKGLVIASLS